MRPTRSRWPVILLITMAVAATIIAVPSRPTPAGAADDFATTIAIPAVTPRAVQGGTLVAELPPTPAVFSLLGVSWHDTSDLNGILIQIRTRRDGTWTAWENVHLLEQTADAARGGGSEPMHTGHSTAVAARVLSTGGTLVSPTLVLIDASAIPSSGMPGGDAAAEAASSVNYGATTSFARARSAAPAIIRRAGWGANESWVGSGIGGRSCLWNNERIRGAVIHHTAGTNDYTAAEAAGLVRGIYYYHAVTLKWCDIGYNFLVDKYGRIYEGRTYSMTHAAHGAHALYANTDSVGVSVMMNSQYVAPTTAALRSVIAVTGWRLNAYDVNPMGTTTYWDGSTPRTVSSVAGHKEPVPTTECPGRWLAERLPQLRQGITWKVADGRSTVSYSVPDRVTLGTRPKLSGKVGPVKPNSTVEVDLRAPDGTVRTAVARVTASSSFSTLLPTMSGGTHHVRVRLLVPGYETGTTLWRPIVVNSGLVESSVTGLYVGETLTVKGTSAGVPAGSAIAMDYRRDGESMWITDVAASQLDSNGAWALSTNFDHLAPAPFEVRFRAGGRSMVLPLTRKVHTASLAVASAPVDGAALLRGRTSASLKGARVVLELDGGRDVGGAVVDAQGAFALTTAAGLSPLAAVKVRVRVRHAGGAEGVSPWVTLTRQGTDPRPVIPPPAPTASPAGPNPVPTPTASASRTTMPTNAGPRSASLSPTAVTTLAGPRPLADTGTAESGPDGTLSGCTMCP